MISVDFADVGEKFIAEAFAGAGALDETGDVDELEHGRDDLLRFRDVGKDGWRRSSGTVTMPLFGSMVQKG